MAITPFIPHPLIGSAQLQTIIGNMVGKPGHMPNSKLLPVQLPDGDKLYLTVDEPPGAESRIPTVMLVHGLCSSGDSMHNRRISRKLFAMGIRVVRFNHRGAQPRFMQAAKKLYHGACFDDLLSGIQLVNATWPQSPLFSIGFSLSANMLLTMAAKYRDFIASRTSLRGIMAICPPIDVKESAEALGRFHNLVLDQYFTFRMRRILKQHNRVHGLPKRVVKVPILCRVKTFDARYTSQVLGFENVDQYYDLCSARAHLTKIEIPTAILASADDPIVPAKTLKAASYHSGTQLMMQSSGGHLGFLTGQKTLFGDRYWMDQAVWQWLTHLLQHLDLDPLPQLQAAPGLGLLAGAGRIP